MEVVVIGTSFHYMHCMLRDFIGERKQNKIGRLRVVFVEESVCEWNLVVGEMVTPQNDPLPRGLFRHENYFKLDSLPESLRGDLNEASVEPRTIPPVSPTRISDLSIDRDLSELADPQAVRNETTFFTSDLPAAEKSRALMAVFAVLSALGVPTLLWSATCHVNSALHDWIRRFYLLGLIPFATMVALYLMVRRYPNRFKTRHYTNVALLLPPFATALLLPFVEGWWSRFTGLMTGGFVIATGTLIFSLVFISCYVSTYKFEGRNIYISISVFYLCLFLSLCFWLPEGMYDLVMTLVLSLASLVLVLTWIRSTQRILLCKPPYTPIPATDVKAIIIRVWY
eukprot:Protomagalhaensia_wolfi_Nauph_80__1902@NODE_2195_length_1173_cov_78_145503_g1715_i0_p1_GENE_NODE_2195_length_1173_cov_78_145503_g1715_i0NODE_2195_length_1173_cov_78_145503_g1715_i0_p1_ORF_typecomplete_len340_score24_45YfhO/PF09586_10/1_37TMRDISM_7TM/PF07695_11/9_27TMRDISM_7TM/PF07695_11/35L_HMGIC_fpl/PF10242_9/24L_HMGIC_fpl/PF10242_9/31L_HMGIC_fpl/PF10242_9/5_8e03DUF2070/PF09843_9/9_NODE_2195_length_1173_cov_78_145503_g1715_i0701089